VNKPWLDVAIVRGDDIFLATSPSEWSVLNRRLPDGTVVRTGFGREYDYLTAKGYRYDSKTGKMMKGGQ
jgi:filamentous hemagglutinin